MGKRFIKFRIFRAIPTFQSCRSKESSSAIPANPVPSFLRLSSAATTTTTSAAHKSTHTPPPPPPKPQRHSPKRHVNFLGSHFTPRSFREDSGIQSSSSSSSRFRWGKDPKWHIIAKIPDYDKNDHSVPPRRKIYTSPNEDRNDVVLFPPLSLKNRRRRRRPRSFQKIRISTSSDSGLFSDDDGDDDNEEREDGDDEETDSSTPRPSNASKSGNNTQCGSRFNGVKVRKTTKKKRSFKLAAEEEVAPARLSEFMRKMVPCRAVEGKVRESFAVVKKSQDPYEDFKRSMAEMVVEKQMFEAAELEELLRCFLSLNSVHHHDAIVRAFTEIWDALFSQSSS